MRTAATSTLGLAVAGAVAGRGLSGSVAAQDDVSITAVGPFRTTAALNLRNQPSLSGSIILVIPNNVQVTAVGPEQNGFINVSYNGKVGWAHGDYLTVSSGGTGDTPAFLGMGKTTAAVNMRSGAGMNFSVKRVIPSGASVEIYDRVANNYRLVFYAGELGWVFADYISAGGSQPGQLTTTADLNLRAEPSLAGKILKVIPQGAKVNAGDQVNNGYRAVTYQGVSGWASVAFLK